MKKWIAIYLFALSMFICTGCSANRPQSQVLATTAPIYTFTTRLCSGTDIQIDQLITEDISCLHNYTLQTKQMRAIESAEIIIISGAGLEDFLDDSFATSDNVIDASKNIQLLCPVNSDYHDHSSDHQHEYDPHIWLSPSAAMQMSINIANGLCKKFPAYEKIIQTNLTLLITDLEELQGDAEIALSQIESRKIITFHDGFSYMADAFNLEILHSIEEESGSEASATELIEISNIVIDHNIRSIFTERNGSTSAANIIAAETGVKIFELDTGISEGNYFDVMYRNINILKEGLQ